MARTIEKGAYEKTVAGHLIHDDPALSGARGFCEGRSRNAVSTLHLRHAVATRCVRHMDRDGTCLCRSDTPVEGQPAMESAWALAQSPSATRCQGHGSKKLVATRLLLVPEPKFSTPRQLLLTSLGIVSQGA